MSQSVEAACVCGHAKTLHEFPGGDCWSLVDDDRDGWFCACSRYTSATADTASGQDDAMSGEG